MCEGVAEGCLLLFCEFGSSLCAGGGGGGFGRFGDASGLGFCAGAGFGAFGCAC